MPDFGPSSGGSTEREHHAPVVGGDRIAAAPQAVERRGTGVASKQSLCWRASDFRAAAKG
eukprot:15446396-Alexandrium_andersonii.AAC.1